MSEDYLLGTADDEIRRLGMQHRVWQSAASDSWRRAGFGWNHRILDLGCGPGFASLDLAHLVGPNGRVVALDTSQRFLDLLRDRARLEHVTNIELVQADVETYEPQADSLDGAYARWIFCFLRDPLAVLARLAQALRPGASLVTLDYFNYRAMTFAPRSEALQHVLAAVERSWLASGGDLGISGRLPAMATSVGLSLVSVEVHALVARPGDPRWEWPKAFFRGFLPRLVAEGHLTQSVADEAVADWAASEARPDAFLQLPPMYELILRRDR